MKRDHIRVPLWIPVTVVLLGVFWLNVNLGALVLGKLVIFLSCCRARDFKGVFFRIPLK